MRLDVTPLRFERMQLHRAQVQSISPTTRVPSSAYSIRLAFSRHQYVICFDTMTMNEGMPPELEIRYEVRREDFGAASWEVLFARSRATVFGMGAIGVLALGLGVAQWILAGDLTTLSSAVAFIMVVIVCYRLTLRRGYSRVLEHQKTMRLRLAPDGLTVSDLKSNSLVAWETVSAIHLGASSVIFLFNQGQNVFAPRRALDADEADRLRAWARWHALAPITNAARRQPLRPILTYTWLVMMGAAILYSLVSALVWHE